MKNVAKFFVLFTALFSGLFSAGQAFAEIDNIEYGGSVFYDVDSFDGVYNAEGDWKLTLNEIVSQSCVAPSSISNLI